MTTAMPKLVFIRCSDINQHEDILGPDEDNRKLDKWSLEAKHRSALKLFNLVAGHGG